MAKPQSKQQTLSILSRLRRHLHEAHELRNKINAGLAGITEQNLSQALGQKKRLKELKTLYASIAEEAAAVLPPVDAATVLEPEFDYITTIENVLTTTQELKRGPAIEPETLDAIKAGLLEFYHGLRLELATASLETKTSTDTNTH